MIRQSKNCDDIAAIYLIKGDISMWFTEFWTVFFLAEAILRSDSESFQFISTWPFISLKSGFSCFTGKHYTTNGSGISDRDYQSEVYDERRVLCASDPNKYIRITNILMQSNTQHID